MVQPATKTTNHRPDGSFAPGNKAQPTTRLKRAPRSLLLECTSEEQVRRLITDAFKRAEDGDPIWSTWLLNRVVPPLRPTAPRIEFELNVENPVQAARDILAATADGKLSTDQSKDLLSSLASLSQIIEVEELKAQVEELKQIMGE
jgi:hypothetical protein